MLVHQPDDVLGMAHPVPRKLDADHAIDVLPVRRGQLVAIAERHQALDVRLRGELERQAQQCDLVLARTQRRAQVVDVPLAPALQERRMTRRHQDAHRIEPPGPGQPGGVFFATTAKS
jgi:hypothetical protein